MMNSEPEFATLFSRKIKVADKSLKFSHSVSLTISRNIFEFLTFNSRPMQTWRCLHVIFWAIFYSSNISISSTFCFNLRSLWELLTPLRDFQDIWLDGFTKYFLKSFLDDLTFAVRQKRNPFLIFRHWISRWILLRKLGAFMKYSHKSRSNTLLFTFANHFANGQLGFIYRF